MKSATVHSLLTPENCTVILIDHQPQMLFGTSNFDRQAIINNTVALAKATRVFDVPVVLTTGESGPLTAWKRSGSVFASGGFGIMYALGRNMGFFGEIRGQRMFPKVGTVIPIQLGYMVGI